VAAKDFDETFSATVTVRNVDDRAMSKRSAFSIVKGLMAANLEVSTNKLMLTELAPAAAFNIVNLGQVPLRMDRRIQQPVR